MNSARAVETKLQSISRELQERGESDLAREVEDVVTALRRQSVDSDPPGGVMTTGEAAGLLGVRSINTIKRWAREGLLEGFRRGGRVVISRRSVECMLRSSQVAEQKAFEAELTAALEPFGVGQEEPSVLPWAGRKPWAKSSDGER